MTIEIVIVLALIVVALTLFVSEALPVDLVAMIILATLLLSGIVTVEQGLSGFSNPATVTVGAMFILSAGLYRSGAINSIGTWMGNAGRFNFWWGIALMMIVIGTISAFINNTAAVAIFIPVALKFARAAKVSASKVLIPLSFASMFGGICTFVGTSTNILVSSIAESHGRPPFSMFEFTRLGLILFGAGIVYMLLIGIRLIPDRRQESDLTETFRLNEYLTEVVIQPESKSIGRTLINAPLLKNLDLDVVHVMRGQQRIVAPAGGYAFAAHDILTVRCSVETIQKLQEREGVILEPHARWIDSDLTTENAALVEAVIAPASELVGRTLEQIQFRQRFGATVLALRHRGGTVRREKLSVTPLRGGDTLLIEVRRENLSRLADYRTFVIVNETTLPQFRKKKILPAILIIGAVIGAAALGMVSIVVSAIAGIALMILSRCITVEEAYRAVEWKVIFLLAGILPLGVALEKSGAAALLSRLLIDSVGAAGGPVAVVSALYILTSLLTEGMSNNAAAALLAPIAIVAAEAMHVDAQPFLMAVAFAASNSFLTPVGYQTNTMIYGPGRYKFSDFFRVGFGLNMLFWLLATILIPRFWAF